MSAPKSKPKSEQFDLAINNAQALIFNPKEKWQHSTETLSVGCKDGKITVLSPTPLTDAKKIIDAKGLHLLPGCIDSQVHFREPGLTHKEDLAAGTLGALKGGITAVFEMPNTTPSTTTTERFEDKMGLAKNRCWVNYAFFIGADKKNTDQLSQLEQLFGCCGTKIFMGSSTGSLLVDDTKELEAILRSGRRPIAVHCEDETRLKERKSIAEKSQNVADHPNWRDEQTSFLATKRITDLSQKTERPIHVLHITSKKEMEYLKTLKDKGQTPITVECLPQQLTFHAPECYEQLGAKAQMNPPIRSLEHQKALWQGISDGTVDVIGSDHAPHTLEEKSKPYPQSPSGMPGVQTLLPVMLTHVNDGRLSLERLTQLICSNPCRIYGVKEKGQIAPGFDADFTLIDLKAQRTIEDKQMACLSGWTPYSGFKAQGWPIATILAGQIAMYEDEIIGHPKGQPVLFA